MAKKPKVIVFHVPDDGNPFFLQFREQCLKVGDPEIDHKGFFGGFKIAGVLFENGKRRAGGGLFILIGYPFELDKAMGESKSQVLVIPFHEFFGIACFEKYAAYTGYFLHRSIFIGYQNKSIL
jgi:hypothetical protein